MSIQTSTEQPAVRRTQAVGSVLREDDLRPVNCSSTEPSSRALDDYSRTKAVMHNVAR